MRLVRGIVSQGVSQFTADNYFARVESAGGSFDLTSINAGYTDAYVKAAHSALFSGLDADGVLAKLKLLDLQSFKTFAGREVPVLGLVNSVWNNFVAGDWVAAGAGFGVKGNKLDKYVDHVSSPAALGLSDNDASAGYYSSVLPSVACAQGVIQSTTQRLYIRNFAARYASSGHLWDSSFGANNGGTLTNPAMVMLSRTAVNSLRLRFNVSLIANNTGSQSGVVPTIPVYSHAYNNGAGISEPCDHRQSLFFLGDGLTDADCDNFYNRIQTFITAMTAF